MMSVKSLACATFDQYFIDHQFSDTEFGSWDFNDLISEPESNHNSPDSAETYQSSPVSVKSNHGLIYSTKPANEPANLDERKLKRMKSNRESARRSRMRKQQHVEKLKISANRLDSMNRDLSNRLRFILLNGQIIRSENQGLQTEHTMLRQRLIELQNSLIHQGIQQMNYQNYNTISSNIYVAGGYGYAQTLINEPTQLIA